MLIDNQDQIINRFIQRIEQADVIILSGHVNTVTAIDICQQRNLLVSGSDDKTVKLWNLQNNSLIKTYQYSGLVNAVVFSNNANLLAFGGRGDYETQLVDISDQEKYNNIYELIGHTKDINKLAFSNNCKYLLSGSDDKTIRIWDCQSKKEKFKLNLGSSIGIAIRADDALIVSNSKFGKVQIWNFLTQKLLCEMSTWMRGCEIQFSFNQKMLVSSSKFGDIKLWSLEQLNQRKLILIRKFKVVNHGIQTVIFIPCSRYILSHYNTRKLYRQSSNIKIVDLWTWKVVRVNEFQSEINSYALTDVVPIAITKNLQILAEGNSSTIRVLKI